MKFIIEEMGKTVLSGSSSEYHIEVCHGGYGGEIGNGLLINGIIKTVKRVEGSSFKWEPEQTFILSLDEDAAVWLAEAIMKISSGEGSGYRKLFN